MSCSLLEESLQAIPQQWFDDLKCFDKEEVIALQAWHDGKITLEEAARAITRPVVDTPLPELDSYDNRYAALYQLCQLLINALTEWPSARTPELILLLNAISRVSGGVHRGAATDADEMPYSMVNLPYFHPILAENHWEDPSDIVKETTEEATRASRRRLYLKQQDVEAQLIAADIYLLGDCKWVIKYLIHALESKVDPSDEVDPNDPYGPVKLDFHIPAVASWIRHNGRKVYNSLLRDDMMDWKESDIPAAAMQFEQPVQRWLFWEKRLQGVAETGSDEDTRVAATLAVKYMKEFSRTQTKVLPGRRIEHVLQLEGWSLDLHVCVTLG